MSLYPHPQRDLDSRENFCIKALSFDGGRLLCIKVLPSGRIQESNASPVSILCAQADEEGTYTGERSGTYGEPSSINDFRE